MKIIIYSYHLTLMLLQTWINYFLWWTQMMKMNQVKIFEEMLVTKELLVAIDFHIIFHAQHSSNIIQNCVQQKKETHTGLE